MAKLFLTAPKQVACEALSTKPQTGLLCHEGLDAAEADPQEVEMGSPFDSSPGSDLSSSLGCGTPLRPSAPPCLHPSGAVQDHQHCRLPWTMHS